MMHSPAVFNLMVGYHEERKRLREEVARKERELLSSMTPDERSEYWEARKVRALEDNAAAMRDAAAASRSLASARRCGSGGSSGMGFGLGVVLGVALGGE